MPLKNRRNKVFISYSHQDIEWLNLLRPHFKPLERDFKIKFWDDTKIKPGTKWRNEIKSALNTAKIAICLVSANFIASDFITNNELPPLLEAAQKDGARIISLIISPCMFEESKLSQYQSANPPSKPLTALTKNDQQQFFLTLSRTIAEEFRKEKLEVKSGFKKTTPKAKGVSSKNTQPTESESAEEAELFAQFREEFREADRRSFTFLLVGRTGVGKSSTINSLLGKRICKVGRYRTTTSEVKTHRSEIEGIRFSVVDTPGLGDDDAGDGKGEKKDRLYLGKIKSKIRRVDSMMFVTRLDEPRVRSDEIRTVRLVSELFGNEIWDRTVIVFTCADKVKPKRYIKDLTERTKLIRKEIAKHTKWTKARSIPAVAVANDEETHKPIKTPDGNQWLGELFTQIFLRVSNEGAIPFYLATRSRIKIKKKPTTRGAKQTSTKLGFGYLPVLSKNEKQTLEPSGKSTQQLLAEKTTTPKSSLAESDSKVFEDRIKSIFAQPAKTTAKTNNENETINGKIPLTPVQSKKVHDVLEKTKVDELKPKMLDPMLQTNDVQIKVEKPLTTKLLTPVVPASSRVTEYDNKKDSFIEEDNDDEQTNEIIVLTEKQANLIQKEVISKNPVLSALEKFGKWVKGVWNWVTGK